MITQPEDIKSWIKEGKLPYGGPYEMFYVTSGGNALCAKCANENIELLSDPYDEQWYVIGYDVNYEDKALYCEHCGEQIEPEYGD